MEDNGHDDDYGDDGRFIFSKLIKLIMGFLFNCNPVKSPSDWAYDQLVKVYMEVLVFTLLWSKITSKKNHKVQTANEAYTIK